MTGYDTVHLGGLHIHVGVNKISCSFYDVCTGIRWRSISSTQGTRNSNICPFEALPHYHSSSICQNCFPVSMTKLDLNVQYMTLVLTVICNKSFFS